MDLTEPTLDERADTGFYRAGLIHDHGYHLAIEGREVKLDALLVIVSEGRELLRVAPDGTLTLAEDITPDELRSCVAQLVKHALKQDRIVANVRDVQRVLDVVTEQLKTRPESMGPGAQYTGVQVIEYRSDGTSPLGGLTDLAQRLGVQTTTEKGGDCGIELASGRQDGPFPLPSYELADLLDAALKDDRG